MLIDYYIPEYGTAGPAYPYAEDRSLDFCRWSEPPSREVTKETEDTPADEIDIEEEEAC